MTDLLETLFPVADHGVVLAEAHAPADVPIVGVPDYGVVLAE